MSTIENESPDPGHESAEPSEASGTPPSDQASGGPVAPPPAQPSDAPRSSSRRPWRPAQVVLTLALCAAVLGVLSGFGSRWGLWYFRTGFTLLRWSAYGALAVTVLTLPVLWMTRPGNGRRHGFALALLALVLSAPVFGWPLILRVRAGEVPPIHDITTDTNDPPRFVAIAPLRADAPNPVEYPGLEVAVQQRRSYPDIRPTVIDQPVAEVYSRALAAALASGWAIVGSDLEEGRIEATATTFWFGFRDDVVIRLTPNGERTIVDVRSKSRVGRSDVGTNAKRIRSYLERLIRTP